MIWMIYVLSIASRSVIRLGAGPDVYADETYTVLHPTLYTVYHWLLYTTGGVVYGNHIYQHLYISIVLETIFCMSQWKQKNSWQKP